MNTMPTGLQLPYLKVDSTMTLVLQYANLWDLMVFMVGKVDAFGHKYKTTTQENTFGVLHTNGPPANLEKITTVMMEKTYF